ncbi:MAG: hypothetical protein ABIT23_06570 [Nitrosospira sp.]
MAKTVEFVSEMEDLSTGEGYQFTFHCDKCHRGYTSSYQATPLGIAADLLGTAGGVFESFGSIFGKGQEAAKGVQEALGGKKHSDAHAEAVEEVKPPVQALFPLRPLGVCGRLLERECRFMRFMRRVRT